MQIVKKLLFLLTLQERKNAIFLMGMVLVLAMLEMIGVVSILPFLTVLMNPNLIETNFLLNTAFKTSSVFGVETKNNFLFLLGVVVFLILITTITFKFLTFYIQLRFTSLLNHKIAKRFVEGYLQQPYSWFLNRNSADLVKNIISEIKLVISRGITPMIDLVKQSVIAFAIIITLFFVDPILTIVIGLTFGISYYLVYLVIRKFALGIGQKRLEATKWIFISITEAFGAIKEIKVTGHEQTYIKRFSKPSLVLSRISVLAAVISSLPRFFLEAITFGGMLLVVLYLMMQNGNFSAALPVIAIYTYAGYRLMPTLQQIYASLIALRFVGPAVDALYKELKSLKTSNLDQTDNVLLIKKNITLKNINFNYANSSRTTLKNINFNIPAKTSVGIVGATGSGKTTLVDIILGLLEAQQGLLEVDGKEINNSNSKSWQRSIGYVPQHIFLSDDTVAANIAFGVYNDQIDYEAVERAAKIAKLHEFVTSELPQKYQTTIGERGIRLSGGQRQRIGIARALYNNPKVLILDEASSALDNNTEKQVMSEIKKLEKDITLIMIAHRLITLRDCNSIIILDKGEIKGQGTFEELIKNDDKLKADLTDLKMNK